MGVGTVESDCLCAYTLGTQVEEVVRRFPAVLVPVLVKAATGAAASDFLRTEAFRLTSDVLQRYRVFSCIFNEYVCILQWFYLDVCGGEGERPLAVLHFVTARWFCCCVALRIDIARKP